MFDRRIDLNELNIWPLCEETKDLFSEYEFSIFHNPVDPEEYYKVSCFYEFLIKNDTFCRKIDYGKENIKLFKNTDIVIFSTRWDPDDLKLLITVLNLLLISLIFFCDFTNRCLWFCDRFVYFILFYNKIVHRHYLLIY